jgi:hypothetical protein
VATASTVVTVGDELGTTVDAVGGGVVWGRVGGTVDGLVAGGDVATGAVVGDVLVAGTLVV